MSRTLEEWQAHVAHTHEEKKGTAWCGGRIAMQFVFQDIDHLAYERLREGRLLPCPECLKKIVETLTAK